MALMRLIRTAPEWVGAVPAQTITSAMRRERFNMAKSSYQSSKMASMRWPNRRAILNANGKLGSYFSVSMALTV